MLLSRLFVFSNLFGCLILVTPIIKSNVTFGNYFGCVGSHMATKSTVPVRIVRPPVYDNCLNYPNLNYVSEKICSLE